MMSVRRIAEAIPALRIHFSPKVLYKIVGMGRDAKFRAFGSLEHEPRPVTRPDI